MIKLIQTRSQWLEQRSQLENSLGLVPTMGNLHQGHLSLAQKALSENENILVTIFVNPKQFGPNEDFERYPRTLEQDLALLESLEKKSTQTIFVFAPKTLEEIYPQGFSSTISVKGISEKLCGLSRPGHFDGVTTVVYQLFALAKADRAYFGQKDYQQFKVIEKMVKDLSLEIELYCCEIIRDQEGLALSSRNQYLKTDEKQVALTLQKTLKKIKHSLEERNFELSHLNDYQKNSGDGLVWEYLEVLDADNLEKISPLTQTAVALGAVKIHQTRLIDNCLIPLNGANIVR